MEQGECRLSVGITAVRRLADEIDTALQVPLNAVAGEIEFPELDLCCGDTSFDSALVPLDGFGRIALNTGALGVKDRDIVRCSRVALPRGALEPPCRLAKIDRDAGSRCVKPPDDELGLDIVKFCGTPIPIRSLAPVRFDALSAGVEFSEARELPANSFVWRIFADGSRRDRDFRAYRGR